MGGIVVAILAFFVILYYWSGKNDDIWEDETFKRLFPKSEKINMQIIYIMALIMFGCAMILEVKYNGKIPTVFIAMVLEDWILVLILIWNHRDNKQNIKYALIYGIISTIILIILYKLGKFDFEDILKSGTLKYLEIFIFLSEPGTNMVTETNACALLVFKIIGEL